MCVTSPPYYGLRDYGERGQIGLEQTPQEYIVRLTKVFDEVKRVLADDGTLWLNIGDTYANKPYKSVKQKDLIGIPWMLAFALREHGWYLRSDIIWHKTNAFPEAVRDRPAKCYEHIFLLAKSPKYYFDYKAIQEPIKAVTEARYTRVRSGKAKYSNAPIGQNIDMNTQAITDERRKMRRCKDVWEVATNTFKMDEHFAMFPEKLIEPCILAGSKEGGVVLDPFFGSGTTGAVAKRLNRECIGIDINPRYVEKAEMRIAEVTPEKPYRNAMENVPRTTAGGGTI
ncbi:MAG TPA: site-specific DNA-methyltransferase [Candidatus Coproplasma stercoravium]|nr:site-specific DNA-methyltransferase [Candidatus Coproplasma stercoravium]